MCRPLAPPSTHERQRSWNQLPARVLHLRQGPRKDPQSCQCRQRSQSAACSVVWGKWPERQGEDEQVSGVEGPGRDPAYEFPFQGSWIPSWDPAPRRLYRQQKALAGFGPTYNSPYRALLIVLKSFN